MIHWSQLLQVVRCEWLLDVVPIDIVYMCIVYKMGYDRLSPCIKRRLGFLPLAMNIWDTIICFNTIWKRNIEVFQDWFYSIRIWSFRFGHIRNLYEPGTLTYLGNIDSHLTVGVLPSLYTAIPWNNMAVKRTQKRHQSLFSSPNPSIFKPRIYHPSVLFPIQYICSIEAKITSHKSHKVHNAIPGHTSTRLIRLERVSWT